MRNVILSIFIDVQILRSGTHDTSRQREQRLPDKSLRHRPADVEP